MGGREGGREGERERRVGVREEGKERGGGGEGGSKHRRREGCSDKMKHVLHTSPGALGVGVAASAGRGGGEAARRGEGMEGGRGAGRGGGGGDNVQMVAALQQQLREKIQRISQLEAVAQESSQWGEGGGEDQD